MARIQLILILLLSGCVSVPDPIAVVPKPPNADALTRALANSQIQASKMNQYISGIYGPSDMSQALLDYQNANRELSAIAQNPWNGFFIMRNAWVK